MTDPIEPLSAEDVRLIHTFAEKAEAYCALLENHERLDFDEFVFSCARLLAELYAAAVALPDHVVYECDETWHLPRSSGLSREAYQSLVDKVGEYRCYLAVYFPYEDEAVGHDCLDDGLNDIYKDLRDGLQFFAVGTDHGLRKAVYEWRYTHWHWGQHAISSLSALMVLIDKIHRKRDLEHRQDDELD